MFYHETPVSELEREVASLTAEVSRARQEEFEAQEEVLETRKQLEEAERQIDHLQVSWGFCEHQYLEGMCLFRNWCSLLCMPHISESNKK